MYQSGLSLAQSFFEASRPLLEALLPDIMACSAAGLVGEGSECLGTDDEISRDHDWGPAFCLWVPDELFHSERTRIEQSLSHLPERFEGFSVRMKPELRQGRVGPFPIAGFYRRFLGMDRPPRTWQEWRAIPEYHLCSCTNGSIFMDNGGEFTRLREALLCYYPDDVRRKKIAARCMIMAQSGQYNLPRSLQRGETVAAMLAAARFAEAALSMVFLLNRRFMPFYKWAGRTAQRLPLLGQETTRVLRQLSCTPWNDLALAMPVLEAIEQLCMDVANELHRQDLTQEDGNWLWTIGPSIQMGASDPEIRRLNVMED